MKIKSKVSSLLRSPLLIVILKFRTLFLGSIKLLNFFSLELLTTTFFGLLLINLTSDIIAAPNPALTI